MNDSDVVYVIGVGHVNKAKALAALWNASKVRGIGLVISREMSVEKARELLEKHQYFDYYEGRVLKLRFSDDVLDLRLYDRDNGHGAGFEAISRMVENDEDRQ